MPGSAVRSLAVEEAPLVGTKERRADDRSGRRRGVEPVAGRDDHGDGTRRCGQQEIDVRLRDGAGRRVVRHHEELRRRLGTAGPGGEDECREEHDQQHRSRVAAGSPLV